VCFGGSWAVLGGLGVSLTSCHGQPWHLTLYTQWQGCRMLCFVAAGVQGMVRKPLQYMFTVLALLLFSVPQGVSCSARCYMCGCLPVRHTCMWGPDSAAADLTVSVSVQPAQFTPFGPRPCPSGHSSCTASAAGLWCPPVLYLVTVRWCRVMLALQQYSAGGRVPFFHCSS
jgi:hypothetical protein